VPLEQADYQLDYDLGYVGETLETLDILDALGTYDFNGLTRFSFNIWRIFPDNVQLGIDWEQMTIEEGSGGDGGGAVVPATSAWSVIVLTALLLGVSLFYLRKRTV
jgi:hypothetical protein